MKTLRFLVYTITICFNFLACSNDDDSGTSIDTTKQIITFQFLAADNAALPDDVDGIINENTNSITITVPSGTDATALLPEIEISAGATINPAGVQNFTSPIVYTVTAEDSSTITYTVEITIEESDEKRIIDFYFSNLSNPSLPYVIYPEIDEEDKTISYTMPNGTDISNLVPTVEIPTGATISPDTAVNFTSPVTYTITAENGSTVDYIVTITVALAPRDILILIDETNPGNTLGWDTTSLDISTWAGVTTDINGNVYSLNLNNKQLTNIPAETGQLLYLSYLNLSDNNIETLPEELDQFYFFVELNLSNNNLNQIPEIVWELTDLKTLTLTNNNIEDISGIGQLVDLLNLNLSGNEIASIPASIGQLTSLYQLSLNDNNLTVIPETIGELTSLSYLNFTENAITALPSTIGNLTGLINFYVSGNNLESFPEEIWQLTNL